MLDVCGEVHREVCYEGLECPVCEAVNDAEETEKEMQAIIDGLEKKVAELEVTT